MGLAVLSARLTIGYQFRTARRQDGKTARRQDESEVGGRGVRKLVPGKFGKFEKFDTDDQRLIADSR
jgi:hypothetical protein